MHNIHAAEDASFVASLCLRYASGIIRCNFTVHTNFRVQMKLQKMKSIILHETPTLH